MKTYLTRRNSDIIEDAFNNFFRPFYVDEEASIMKTDIRESDNAYLMDVEMAGFDKSDISLKYESGYLTVSAKKEEKADNVKYIRRERAYSCSRSYYLGDVDEKAIKAKYNNGVLEIVVPKEKPQAQTHAINIEQCDCRSKGDALKTNQTTTFRCTKRCSRGGFCIILQITNDKNDYITECCVIVEDSFVNYKQ